jgi:hypothetical protein
LRRQGTCLHTCDALDVPYEDGATGTSYESGVTLFLNVTLVAKDKTRTRRGVVGVDHLFGEWLSDLGSDE